MFGLGAEEIVIILVVFGVLFFGGKKLSDIAHAAGRFTGEFKKGKLEIENELASVKKDLKIK